MGMLLGLTGGMASGKSSVLSLLADLGWHTVSADSIVRDLLAQDEAVMDGVRAIFGDSVFCAAGHVDRRCLAVLVFEDAVKRQKLEDLLHPRVRQVWQEQVSSGGDWVVEIPLLFEKKLEKLFDFTVTVSTLPTTQRRRLHQSRHDLVSAEQRMGLQLPNSVKAGAADFVISNLGSQHFLAKQVQALHAYLHSIS